MADEIKKNGRVVDYFMSDTAQMKSRGEYKDGKKEGNWSEWWITGNKKSEGSYKDGKQDGKWTEWSKNGKKVFEGVYKDGEKVGVYKDGEKEEVKRELLNDSVKVSFNDTKNTTSTLNTPSRNSETLTVEMKGVQTVRISDIDIPFVSMVIFIIKWTIASIPALIILMILFAIFGGFIMAIFN
jgi:hypothetical protein